MIIIHHNPNCGTSRNVLAIVRATGAEPGVIEYLKEGWTRPQLLALFAVAGLTPRAALRSNVPEAEGLAEASDTAILEAMLAHPVLVNRPIVASPRGVRLCRPCEAVLPLLDRAPPPDFRKEDGTPLSR